MGEPTSRTGSMWDHVRGHAVVRAGIVYGSAVFFLLQVLDLLGVSERTIRVLAILSAVAFVVGEGFFLWKARRPTAAAAVPARLRRWVVGGKRWVSTAVILLLLGVSAWLIGRRLVRSPVRAGTDVMAVVPFVTSGDEVEDLGLGMVSLLSTNLDQAGGIRMIDPATVLHSWNQRARGGMLDLQGALQVGRDVRAGAVLSGSVAAIGDVVQLTGEIHTVDGNRVAHRRERGDKNDLPALIDRLSVELLREIWRGDTPVPDLRLSAITTGSPVALRAFLRGERHLRAARYDSAIDYFRAAVREDFTFALAHFRLSEAYSWVSGISAPPAVQAGEAAIRFSDRLPERERSLMFAFLLHMKGNFAALDSLHAITVRYPDDPLGWYILSEVLYHSRFLLGTPADEVISSFRRATALDPTPGGTVSLLWHSLTEGNDRPLFDEFIEDYRASVGPELAAWNEQLAQVRWAPADSFLSRAFEAAHQLAQEWRSGLPLLLEILCFRFATDMELDPDALIAVLESESSGPLRTDLLFYRVFILQDLGRIREASALLDTLAASGGILPPTFLVRIMWGALGLYPADSIPAQFALHARDTSEWSDGTALRHYYLAMGDLRAAENVKLEPLPPDTLTGPNPGLAIRMSLDARAQLLRGDTTRAVSMMQAAVRRANYYESDFFMAGPHFLYAVALSRTTEWRAEGIGRLRSYLRLRSFGVAVLSYMALAEALEADGDRAGAADAYGHVVRLWKNADPHLQPVVRQARDALARLTGER